MDINFEMILWALSVFCVVALAVQYYSVHAKLKNQIDFDNLEARITWLRAQEQELRDKCKDLQTMWDEREKLNRDIESLRNSVDELEMEEIDLRERISGMDQMRQELERLDGELQERNESLESLEEEIRELEQTLREVQIQIAELDDQFDKKRSEVQELNAELNSLRDAIATGDERLTELESQIQEKTRALNALEAELNTKRSSIQRLETELDDLKEDIEKQEQRNRDRIQEMEVQYQQQEENLKADIQSLQNNYEEVLKQNKEIESENRQLIGEKETLECQLKSIEEQIEIKEQQLEALAQDLINARNDLKATGNTQDTSQCERLSHLWEPVFTQSNETLTQNADEQKTLTWATEHIAKTGLNFPERTIHAFHTGLKIADISSLVVLAGISGTGKSELPRRYCEGMGINFLTLAVQPGWDSPQDLFGFYNYMENKYNATVFSRAMIQFELFNRHNFELPEGWDHSKSDQMLLVLFDEMNLARVEYYFSEFLSKLEVRRGLDTSNLHDRSKAEINLEIGALSEGESPVHLFPGSNMLFTGTMNEDETTQSLSDKVLDRASVIRFGRPNSIVNRNLEGTSSSNPVKLTHKVWQDWLSAGQNAGASEADWINELNIIMDGFQRPFGHRVGQAIQSYIDNYPNWVNHHSDLAKADQIEQKVLPKLRGVIIQDHAREFDRLRDLIDGTNDKQLLRAFNEARNRNNALSFAWHGIDRADEDK